MTAPAGTAPAILRYGEPCLRQVCRAPAVDEDVSDLVGRLWSALDRAVGVGLAGPQLGDPRRVIVCQPPRDRGAERLALVDPVIEAQHGPTVVLTEGCLSFPGLYARVARPQGVTVRYRDVRGQPQRRRAEGLLARIVQHEVDHLDGVLFTDRMSTWRRWSLAWRLYRIRCGSDNA